MAPAAIIASLPQFTHCASTDKVSFDIYQSYKELKTNNLLEAFILQIRKHRETHCSGIPKHKDKQIAKNYQTSMYNECYEKVAISISKWKESIQQNKVLKVIIINIFKEIREYKLSIKQEEVAMKQNYRTLKI